ncbi:MAG TPA: hypothetical protein VE685_18940 [Thermoanaerobaculia bacterium]|nr:hypothetical protein [Thermoanaerobaculia bacterium]
MNLASVEPVADAILFEGYLLYPYRASALKNRHRWIFGVLCPRSASEARGGLDPWTLQSEFLLVGGADTEVEAVVRFLHPLRRGLGRLGQPAAELPASGADLQPVDSLQVGDRLIQAGEEASPVRIDPGPLRLRELEDGWVRRPFTCPARRDVEAIRDGAGLAVAAFVREQERLEGLLEIAAARVAEGVFKLTVRVSNVTPPPVAATGGDRKVLHSFVSTHWMLGVRGGELVSLLDPPPPLRAAAEDCRNLGVWPVLVGARGQRDTVLCSPIILDDYPAVAPESPGDSFDGTEIDELLTLSILALSADERRRMAAADERTRALLERTEALRPEQLQRLHGRLRGPGPAAGPRLGPGDRVRLRPQGRADIFDLALAGRRATILSVEQDFEDRVYYTVTVDDDPGRDLGAEGKPGHRFFFAPEEVELLEGD